MSNTNIPKVYEGKSVCAHSETETARPVYIRLGVAGHYLSVDDATALSAELATAASVARPGNAKRPIPARIAWMHARCVYIREMTAEGDSPEEIARTLGMTDVMQVRLLAATDPDTVIAPYRKSP